MAFKSPFGTIWCSTFKTMQVSKAYFSRVGVGDSDFSVAKSCNAVHLSHIPPRRPTEELILLISYTMINQNIVRKILKNWVFPNRFKTGL